MFIYKAPGVVLGTNEISGSVSACCLLGTISVSAVCLILKRFFRTGVALCYTFTASTLSFKCLTPDSIKKLCSLSSVLPRSCVLSLKLNSSVSYPFLSDWFISSFWFLMMTGWSRAEPEFCTTSFRLALTVLGLGDLFPWATAALSTAFAIYAIIWLDSDVAPSFAVSIIEEFVDSMTSMPRI